MNAYKDKQFLVFEFEDGKNVKYNLATGETIGKSGKVVKSINQQLSNYNLSEVMNSFDNKNYINFLKFLNDNFINKSTRYDGYRYVNNGVCERIRNIGTFLSRIKDYDYFEQIFACGIENVSPQATTKLTDVPKGCIKIMRESCIKYSDEFITAYKGNPDLFNWIAQYDFLTLGKKMAYELLYIRTYRNNSFVRLINDYHYNTKFLFIYLDNLLTYEALNVDIIRELEDYARMMSAISPKYDMFPKNFLTTHRIAVRNYERLRTTFNEQIFQNRINKDMEFTWEDYKIIYPESTQAIKDEATQQHHCVASYIDRVIDGKTDIVFLRLKEKLDESLVTLQVTGRKVVQAKGRFNRDLTDEEQFVVDKYNKYLEKIS